MTLVGNEDGKGGKWERKMEREMGTFPFPVLVTILCSHFLFPLPFPVPISRYHFLSDSPFQFLIPVPRPIRCSHTPFKLYMVIPCQLDQRCKTHRSKNCQKDICYTACGIFQSCQLVDLHIHYLPKSRLRRN